MLRDGILKRLIWVALAATLCLASACSGGAGDPSLITDNNGQNNGEEIEVACSDGFDNDGDRAPDCADTDCAADPACLGEVEDCSNGTDDDDDGAIDCDDIDCAADLACAGPVEDCRNGQDDDGDGDVDCDDVDCVSDNACKRETRCDDGDDDDQDGDTDCDDEDCAGDPACGPPAEVCDDGVDNDQDGDTDCDDADCANDPGCQAGVEICDDGADNDDDAAIDCDDSDCDDDPACAPAGEICDDGIDNDEDGAIDCADANCDGDPACAPDVEICDDGLDNDEDRFIDCADPDCDGDRACEPTGEICDDGFDNDQDGATDCQDDDCIEDPACRGRIEICDDGTDNDNDQLIDCADPDCEFHDACNPTEICDDGIDNDDDGRADCDDVDCVNDPNCLSEDICDDGEDNDGDFAIDCDDQDCELDPACRPADACADPIDASAPGTFTGSTVGGEDNYAPGCSNDGAAAEVAFAVTVPQDTVVCVDSAGSDFDTIMYLRTTCDDPGAEIDCNDDAEDLGLQSEIEFQAVAGQTYYVFVDGFSGAEGEFVFTVAHAPCGQEVLPEVCDDNVDNDNDGDVDCDDSDCEGLDLCAGLPGTCASPLQGGVGEFTGSTSALPHEQSGTCRDSVAPEAIYTFQFDVDTTLCADTFGSTFDTVLYAQTECGVSDGELECNDDAGVDLQSEIEFVAPAGQQVFLVVDGFGTENGLYTLSVAEGPCGVAVETECADNEDNDGDRLVDCDDQDCVDDPACVVLPEVCDDLEDNDGDNLIDCDDPDCAADPLCIAEPENCIDFIDNDGDNLIDCEDPDCAQEPGCQVETCDDLQDNDGDNLVDCDDPDCAEDPLCIEPEVEDCDDGADNDGDNLVDCDDPDCDGDAFCVDQAGTCADPFLIDRAGQFSGSNVGRADDLDGSCQGLTGAEAVYAVQFNQDATVCLDTAGSGYDTVLYVRTTCDDANSDVVCNDDAIGLQSEVELDAVAGQLYFVVVDAFSTREGDYLLNLRFGGCDEVPEAEVCTDGADNDLDGLTDCDDADCLDDAFCVDGEFTCANPPFVAEGANTGSTLLLEDVHTGSCQAFDGAEAVHRLAVTADTTVCLDTNGSAFDTVLYVRETTCDDPDAELDCNDDIDFPNNPQSELELDLVAGTIYYVFVDAFSGESGDYVLNVGIGPCGVQVQEICDDAQDNDGDNLADCDDPDCDADPLCAEPEGVCADPIPIDSLDPIEGNNVPFADNLDGGCQSNTGNEVVHVVAFNGDFTVCADTAGSDYDTVLYVRTTCDDVNAEVGCNDDAIGLQSEVEFEAVAGQTYFLVVDAFGSGEGNYNLNLRLGPCDVEPEAEICLDGVDNDQDGFADCDDAECVDTQACVDALLTCDNAPFIVADVTTGSTVGLQDVHTPSCQTTDGPEAVHRLAVNQDTTVCVDTQDSAFDTVLHVREDVCDLPEAELACNDDIGFDLQSMVELELVAGSVYYVFVDGFNGATGDYTLTVTAGPCP